MTNKVWYGRPLHKARDVNRLAEPFKIKSNCPTHKLPPGKTDTHTHTHTHTHTLGRVFSIPRP